jgi:hypothetical protein
LDPSDVRNEAVLPADGCFQHAIAVTPEDAPGHNPELFIVFNNQDRFRPAQKL